MGVELPEFCSGRCIQREHVIVRRAEEELAIHQNRSGFEGRAAIQLFIVGKRASSKSPQDLEQSDIVAIDLLRGRIARALWIVAIGWPSSIG